MADIDKVITDNIGLVYKQLSRFNLQNDEDAYSWALEALWKAIETFDSSKGYAFSTYAMTCIYNALGCYLRPRRKFDKIEVLSYDNYVDDEDQDISFIDLIATYDTPDAEIISRETRSVVWRLFYEVLKTCDNTSTAVVECWRDSDFSITQTEIAKRLGLSQSYVSRILSAFRHKLKNRLEEYLCEK